MNSYLFIYFQKAPKIGINRRENVVSGNIFDLRNLEQVFVPKRDGRTIGYNFIAIRALFDIFVFVTLIEFELQSKIDENRQIWLKNRAGIFFPMTHLV